MTWRLRRTSGRPLYPASSAELQNLEQSEIEAIVAEIDADKEAEAERKRQRLAQVQAGQASMAMGSSAPSGQATPGAGESDARDMGRESGVQ